MASLQSPSVEDPSRPPVQRPRAASTAPGYPGRKRADAIRTRTAVLLSHAGMWLTGMAQPGNGHRAAFLDHACTQIIALCREVRVALESVVVRADGEFGSLAQIAQIARHKLGWLVRGKDYVALLRHADVRAALSRGSGQTMTQPDSPIVRELFDVPDLVWRSIDGRHEVRTRLIVTRRPWPADRGKPSVGHQHEGFVYELFVTSLPPEAASAAEVVSLYLGRGALEATLAQEDREMPTDRWITHRALGQDLFQMISQWVWNHRVVLGAALISKSALRVTPWDVAVTSIEPTPIVSLPDGASAPSQVAPDAVSAPSQVAPDALSAPSQAAPDALSAPSQAAPDAVSAPSQAAPDAAVSAPITSAEPRAERFGADSFVRDEQGQVHCPSGQIMRPAEVRHRRSGDRQRYRAPLSACLSCSMVSRCCQSTGAILQGRIVDLPLSGALVPRATPRVVSPAAREEPTSSSPPALGPRPPRRLRVLVRDRLLWTDVSACEMRRILVDTLWSEHVEIDSQSNPTAPSELVITRDRRAHRRATWAERLSRNDLGSTAKSLTLHVHGVPDALARLVAPRIDASSSVTKTSPAQEDPR